MKGQTLMYGILMVAMLGASSGQEVFDPFDPTDDDAQTGIAVGEKIPELSAVDQNGKRRTFDDLKGPNGALILFHRSADW